MRLFAGLSKSLSLILLSDFFRNDNFFVTDHVNSGYAVYMTLHKVLQIKAGGRLGTAEYRLYIEFCVSVGDKVHYRRLKITLRHVASYT